MRKEAVKLLSLVLENLKTDVLVFAYTEFQKQWFTFVDLRLYLSSATVSCLLLQQMARTGMDWNFKKLAQLFQVLMPSCLQKSPKDIMISAP